VMLSFHCASSTAAAQALRAALQARGLRVWCCTEDLRVGAAYRAEIGRNAALCGVLVPLISRGWAASSECEYEYNIALRTALVTKSHGAERPRIVPIVLPDAASLFDDMLALAERHPCLLGLASNTNARFLAPAAGAGAEGAAHATEYAEVFASVASEVAALLGDVAGAGAGEGGGDAGAGGDAGTAAVGGGSDVDAGVPFNPERHVVLRSSLLAANYEGYFTDFRKIGDKEVGSRWAWSTALLIATDGALSGAGRDESSTSELAGHVDDAARTFEFVKTCFGPKKKRPWRVFYKGETFDDGSGNTALRGRWDFRDVPFSSMSALCTMSLWAIPK